jgi:hypothetical protein
MDCQIPESCPYSRTCAHKDVAEFCPYHRLNYVDATSKEFREPVYPTLTPVLKEPDYVELRKIKREDLAKYALRKLRKEDLYDPFDPFDPREFDSFENRR